METCMLLRRKRRAPDLICQGIIIRWSPFLLKGIQYSCCCCYGNLNLKRETRIRRRESLGAEQKAEERTPPTCVCVCVCVCVYSTGVVVWRGQSSFGDSAVRVWLPFMLVSRKICSVAAGQKRKKVSPFLPGRLHWWGNIVLNNILVYSV